MRGISGARRQAGTEQIDKGLGKKTGSFATLGLPMEPQMKDGDVIAYKLLPVPLNPEDAVAFGVVTRAQMEIDLKEYEKNGEALTYGDFVYELFCHRLGGELMLCPGRVCKMTKGMPCHTVNSLYRSIDSISEAGRERQLPASQQRFYDDTKAIAKDIALTAYHFYLGMPMGPALEDMRVQIPDSKPCYGDKTLCPAHEDRRIKCPWTDICSTGALRILVWKYIKGPMGDANPGFGMVQAWNGAGQKMRDTIFNLDPDKDGNCQTRLIVGKRTGTRRNTRFKFSVSDQFVVDGDLMKSADAVLGESTMDQLVREHLVYSNADIMDALASALAKKGQATNEDAEEDTGDANEELTPPFDAPAGRPAGRSQQAQDDDEPWPEDDGRVDRGKKPAPVTKPAAPVETEEQREARIREEKIVDKDRIWTEKVEGMDEEVPVCYGRYNPAAWPKCRTEADGRAADKVCPMLVECRRENEAVGAPETVDAMFERLKTKKPTCFANPAIYNPGKVIPGKLNPCIVCRDRKGQEVVDRCGAEIALAKGA